MRKYYPFLFIIILALSSLSSCYLGHLTRSGISTRLDASVKVDGEVANLVSYNGTLYVFALEGEDTVIYTIDETAFDGVTGRYTASGTGLGEFNLYSNGDGSFAPFGYEDPTGTFFLSLGRYFEGNFWLSGTDNTALYFKEGYYPWGEGLHFTSGGTDYILTNNFPGDSTTSAGLRITDFKLQTDVAYLPLPVDTVLLGASLNEIDSQLVLTLGPYEMVANPDEKGKGDIPVTFITLPLESLLSLDLTSFPYGGVVAEALIAGDYIWNRTTSSSDGFNFTFPSALTFSNSTSFGIYLDDKNYTMYVFAKNGELLSTFDLEERSHPVMSNTLEYVYAGINHAVFRYRVK